MAHNPAKDVELRFFFRLFNLTVIFNVFVIFSSILCFFVSSFFYQLTWRWLRHVHCVLSDKPECRGPLLNFKPDNLWDFLWCLLWENLEMGSNVFVIFWKSFLFSTTYCFRKDTIEEMTAAREEGRYHECLLHTLLPFYTLLTLFLMYNAAYVIFCLFGKYNRIFEVLDYPLHFAVKHNHYFHLEFYLTTGGWDVNGSEPKYDLKTPLNYVNCNDPKTVRLLLLMGADIRKTDSKLMYRAVKTGNQKTLSLLVNAGIDRVHLHTTVQVAVMLGKSDVLKFLVKREGRINMPSGVDSPLHLAVKQQSTDMVQILLDAGALMSLGKNGNTPAHIAAKYRNRELASMLIYRTENLEQINSDGYTVLHVAVKARNEVVTKLLLDSGANICARDSSHLSALHMACSDPHEDMLMIIQLLLNKGASINDMTPTQVTPFHLAVQYQKLSTIHMLLQRDADPNIVTLRKETILHFAAANKEDQEVLKLFLSMGFDSGVRTLSAHTPITYAAQHGAFSNYLFLLRECMQVLESDMDCYEVFRTLLATASKSIKHEADDVPYYQGFATKLIEQVEEQLAKEASSDVARIARAALRYLALAEHKSEDDLYNFFFSEINSQKIMRNYYIRCKNELLKLERLKLMDPVIAMLTGNDEELLNYTTRVDMQLKVWEHRDKFPLYHRLIREVFYPVMRDQAQKRESKKIDGHILALPSARQLIAEKILGYFRPSRLDNTL